MTACCGASQSRPVANAATASRGPVSLSHSQGIVQANTWPLVSITCANCPVQHTPLAVVHAAVCYVFFMFFGAVQYCWTSYSILCSPRASACGAMAGAVGFLLCSILRCAVLVVQVRGRWGLMPVEGGPRPIKLTVRRDALLEDAFRGLAGLGPAIKTRLMVGTAAAGPHPHHGAHDHNL